MNPPQQLILFQEGSRNLANPTPLQENERARMMNAIYGPKCLEQFEKFNHVGLWERTFSELLIGQTGWSSRRCKLIWRLRGTKYKRTYFQLVPSTLRTEETEFGLLLKTPTVMDGLVTSGKKNPISGNSGTLAQEIMGNFSPTMIKLGLLPTPTCAETIQPKEPIEVFGNNRIRSKQGIEGSCKLVDLLQNNLLPTPRANQVNGCNLHSENLANRNKGNLEEVIAKSLLPTPTADDNPAKNTGKRNQDSLQKRAFQQTGKTSQLNPRFVAEMMGFPSDWLELPFLSTETSQLKGTETP